MKYLLLATALISSSVFAGDVSYKLLENPLTYKVEVKDSSNNTLYSVLLNNEFKRDVVSSKKTTFVNCKDGKLQADSVDSGLFVKINNVSEKEQILEFKLSSLTSISITNSKECKTNLEKPVISKFTEKMNLPIISYVNKVWLKDKAGNKTDSYYLISITGKRL